MEEGIFIQKVNQTKSKQSVRMADYMGRSTQSFRTLPAAP